MIKLNKEIESKLKEIKKVLEGDGGGLEVIEYDEKSHILQIKLLGMCQGCPMAEITVKDFIEKELQIIDSKIKVEKID